MTYTVVRSPRAQSELAQFAAYAGNHSVKWSREQFEQLNRIFSVVLAQTPHLWSYFYLAGAPYRAYLFRAGRRTQYWIVYTICEETKTVNVLRFWNASRNPENFQV